MNAHRMCLLHFQRVPTTFVRRAIKQISSSQRIFEPLKPLITILNELCKTEFGKLKENESKD